MTLKEIAAKIQQIIHKLEDMSFEEVQTIYNTLHPEGSSVATPATKTGTTATPAPETTTPEAKSDAN